MHVVMDWFMDDLLNITMERVIFKSRNFVLLRTALGCVLELKIFEW